MLAVRRSVMGSSVERTVRHRLNSMCLCHSSSRQVQNDLRLDWAAVRAFEEVIRENMACLRDVLWLELSMACEVTIDFGVAVWVCH